MYFCLCTWKRGDAEVRTRTSSASVKTGKLVCLVAFLCLFFLFVLFVFHFCLFLLFLLSLLHHNKHFLLTFTDTRFEGKKSSCRCNDEAKPFICTALRSMASVRPADTVLLFVPPPLPTLLSNLLSFNCTYCSYTSSQKHLKLWFSFYFFKCKLRSTKLPQCEVSSSCWKWLNRHPLVSHLDICGGAKGSASVKSEKVNEYKLHELDSRGQAPPGN